MSQLQNLIRDQYITLTENNKFNWDFIGGLLSPGRNLKY